MENNQVDINLSTDIKTDNLVPLNITLMSRDINNNSFLLKFKSNGADVQLNNSFTVEILSVFPNSKIEILTQATVYGNTAVWEFDTKYITRNEVVYNYVYVKKDGVPIISADANAFTFKVGLSKIDINAGKTAESYDRNYEKVLHEFEVAINLTKEEWAQMADETREFVDQIKDVTVDQFVENKMGEELANLEVNYATRLTGLESNDANLTAQLAQKANQSFVDSQFSSIVSGAPKGTYTNLSALQSAYPTGAEGIFLVIATGHWYYWNSSNSAWTDGGVYQSSAVGDKAILGRHIADDAISMNHVKEKTFVKYVRTINLFNKNASGIQNGGYLNGNTWVDSPSHSVSDFIPIEPMTGYTLYGAKNPTPVMARFSFYDKDKKYVTGGTAQSAKITGSSYPYVRFHSLTERLDRLMFIKDSDLPEDKSMDYIPYEIPAYQLENNWQIGSGNILDNSVATENILPNAVTAEEIDGVESKTTRTINHFNKDDKDVLVGGYYNAGVWTPSSGNTTSGFIKIEPNTSYTFYHKDPPEQVGSRINFYDSNFNYVSGGSSFSEKLSGSILPYVRVTTQRAYVDSFMMIKDSDIPDELEYMPYEVSKNVFSDDWDVVNNEDLNTLEKKIDLSINSTSHFETPNLTPHTKLDLPDFSGYDQPWHPSAQYIEAGFAGAKYWLTQSPYPNGGLPSRVRWEVPVVYKSNDGVNWTVVMNPLDDLTQAEIDRGDYMSDPEIVWREDLGRLEVWYRHSVGTGTLPTTIFRKTTSDGITWSAREIMLGEKVSTDPLFMRSPSITFEDGKYKAWFTNDSRNLFARPLMYSESVDGKTWSQPTNCTVDIYRTPWHTSVKKIDDVYHYLCYYRPIAWADFAGIGETLFYYTSTDGINYKFERTILSTTDNNSSTFYKNGLYRSDVIKGHDGKIKLYFCFVDDEGKNSIGYMSADNLKVMNAVPKVDARNAVTRNGESLDDLQMKLDRLRRDFDNL